MPKKRAKTAKRKRNGLQLGRDLNKKPGERGAYYIVWDGRRHEFTNTAARDKAIATLQDEKYGPRRKNGKRKKTAKRTKRPAGTKVLPIGKRKRKAKRKNPSKIPAKVLAGHKRIWGGRIPPGALAELEKTYAREALAKKAKRKNPAKRKAAKKRPAKRKANGAAERKRAALFLKKARQFEKLAKAGGKSGFMLGSSGTPADLRSRAAAFRAEAARLKAVKNPAKRRRPAKRKRNGEQLEGAAAMFKKFHGKAASGVKTVRQLRVTPSALADCGKLVELVVDTGRGGRRLPFERNSVRTATTGDGGQLYFVGGDQALDLKEWPGVALPKDQVKLGELASICYHTSKDFHDFKPSDYEHQFGETGKDRPDICYDVHSKRLYLVGGGYQVKRAGIVG